MRFILYILILLTTLTFTCLAQDAEFSQFYNAQLNLNPAFAGIKLGPRVQVIYRNQWPNIQNGFVTYSVAYDQLFPKANSGIGLLLTGDNMANGFYVTNSAYGCYSYAVHIDKKRSINFGAKVGFFQHRIDLSNALYLDQLDPLTYNGNLPPATHENVPAGSRVTCFDMGAGMVYYSQKTFLGIALQHLTAPNESFVGTDQGAVLPMKLTLNLGYEFNHRKWRHRNRYFGPNFMFINQGGYQQYIVGAYYGVNQVFAGLWYRNATTNNDAIIFSFGIKKDYMKIGYSYDATTSALASYTGGAHEISIVLDFSDSKKNKTKKKYMRMKECPFIL